MECRGAKQGLEDELEVLVTAGIGASSWEDGGTPPKKPRNNHQLPHIEKWDCDLEEQEEEDWDIIPADDSELAWDRTTPAYPPRRRRTPNGRPQR